MCNINPENLETENPDIWAYCFDCGTPLSKDMKEGEDWFNIRSCGESFPVCKECHKDKWNVVRTMKGDWTKASHYFKEFHLNTNGAKHASSNGVTIYGYDRDEPFGNRALFNFEIFGDEVWIEVELGAEKAKELDRVVEELDRVESELREKEDEICGEVAGLIDEDIEEAHEKIVNKNGQENDSDSETAIPFELPTFRGYTIDIRLKQFRKVTHPEGIEFIDFDSERGEELLCEMEEYFSFLFEPELS